MNDSKRPNPDTADLKITEENIDIDLTQHTEDTIRPVLTITQGEALRQLVAAITVGDLNRMDFPDELSRPLYDALKRISSDLTDYYQKAEQS